MLNPKRFFLFFVFLFLRFPVYSQEKEILLPLKQILEKISTQHNVKFNYIEDEIIIFKISPPDANFNLEEKLHYIERKTSIWFKKIDNNYYSIFNNSNFDKPLCAYLIDYKTNVPIENAFIQIKESNIQTNSNEKGYFELPITSPNDIIVKHISYEELTIPIQEIYATICPKFFLTPVSKELEEVITQRYLTTGISKKAEGNIVIKPKKFGILPGLIEPDVLQTMQQIPGIISIDETVTNTSVRGGTNDQNLFLWNGIRMFQTGHFFGLISAFNSSLAQNISITKNGSSAFFGESVSSLIEISSHATQTEKSNASIGTNLISAEFYSKFKLSEKASFIISGRRSLTDLIETPTYKKYSERIFQNTVITDLKTNEIEDYKSDVNFNFYDITAQYEQKIGKKNVLNIEAIAIENRLAFHQSTTSLNRNSDLEQENFGAAIHWKTNWNTKNTTIIDTYISKYDLTSKSETVLSNQILNQENKVLNNGVKIKHAVNLSNKFNLGIGYQLDEIGVTNNDNINDPLFTRYSTEVLLSQIGVVEGTFNSLNKKTYLRSGIRINYFNAFLKTLIEPRIQFNQVLNSSLSIEIQAEQKSQTISQVIDLQNDFLGIEKRRWMLANEDSRPILKSNQVALGFTYKKNNWLVSIDNFYKKITGITTSSQGFQNQFEFEKFAGNYTIIGSEMLIQKSFSKFYTWMSYAFNKNQYSFPDLSSNDFPNNFDITHSINWAGIYEWKKLKIALGSKWHTGKPITTPTITNVTAENQTITYNSPNNSRLKDYFQLNFSASRKWEISKKIIFETNVSVLNLLNTKNSINRFYRVNNTLNTVQSVDTFSLGLTPNVNLKLSF